MVREGTVHNVIASLCLLHYCRSLGARCLPLGHLPRPISLAPVSPGTCGVSRPSCWQQTGKWGAGTVPGEQPLAGGGVGRSGKEEASHSWEAAPGTGNDQARKGAATE